MKLIHCSGVFFLAAVLSGCITQFIPDIGVDPEFFVVEGMITDQPGRHSVRLSRSVPLGTEAEFQPLKNCTVWISDDQNHIFQLTETSDGIYLTSQDLRGEVGRKYVLNIEIVHYQPPYYRRVVDYTLRTLPMEMMPVPEIDSLYFEKVKISEEDGFAFPGEGCRILLNTSDPENKCKYYRWDYTDTWQISAPGYQRTINRVCWVTNNSEDINVKAVAGLNENRIERLPVKFISNETDMLQERYRIEVNQYSLSEDEYSYWNDLEKITEQSGNLYDRIPSEISGNIYCSSNPDLQVLGYFSVSAKRSKVIYIDDYFEGLFNYYRHCTEDTTWSKQDIQIPPPGIFDFDGIYYWIITIQAPLYMIVTNDKTCVDCTARGGTTEKPDYWENRE
jgi:hypothetical protein